MSPTRIRVTPAFVDKFDRALLRLEEQASLYLTHEHPEYHEAQTRRVQRIPRQLAVEEFLEEMIHDIELAHVTSMCGDIERRMRNYRTGTTNSLDTKAVPT